MKVCIFCPSLDAYSETFIQNHCRFLPGDKTIITGTDILSLKVDGKPLYHPTVQNRIRNKLTGVAHTALAEKKLKQLLRSVKPDVVLFEFGHLGAALFRYCEQLGIPFVVHFHGNDASHKPTLDALGATYKEMFSKAASIIAVSKSMIERLKKLGAPAEKIFYNPYGVDLQLYTVSSEVSSTQHQLLAVGRFVEKKAPHITILAFNEVLKEFPNVKLTMVGDGPLLAGCKQLVTALGIEKNVDFAGVLEPQMVAANLRQSLAFLQHSVIGEDGSAEGTPNSIIEAGASGVPVVSTRHEGIADVVEHGITGFLVDEFDYKGMAAAIRLLLADEQARVEMGRKARTRIEREFNLQGHIDKLESVLRSNALSAD